MKVFFALMLSLCLLSTTAMASAHEGLQIAFEELAYSVEVDGDEAAATGLFLERLEALQKQGLENAELINFSLAQIKDQNKAAQMSEAYKFIEADQMNDEQLKEFISMIRTEGFKKGASWNGSAVITTSVVLIAVIGVAVYLKTKHDTAKNSVGNIR
jgi:hypothetical protein